MILRGTVLRVEGCVLELTCNGLVSVMVAALVGVGLVWLQSGWTLQLGEEGDFAAGEGVLCVACGVSLRSGI